MPAVAPPPRRMVKPPSIFANRNQKKKTQPPRHLCCDNPKPEDDGEGHTVCMSCFQQLADSNIVSEVQFSEDSRGAAQAQGAFVTNNARHANTMGAGARRFGGNDRDAGQNAAANAKRILAGLVPRLNLSDNITQQSIQLFQLASAAGFSAGRRTDEVVAACLYAVCRRRNENHVLLIDISELQRINVFRLGEVYKALCRDMYLDVNGQSTTEKIVGPQRPIEVESLIMKYCRKLEFGDKTRQVAEDAARILRRMKRDWIVTGRHPAGLCGACIIYAARMNNFRRTKREVVYVAKVADQTVAKRMEEFKRTRSAALTVEQFRQKGELLKQTHDPPAIAEHNRQKEKLEEKKRKRQSASAPPEAVEIGDGPSDAGNRELSEAVGSPEPVQNGDDEGARKRRRTSDWTPATPAPTQQEPRFDADGFAIPALPASMVEQEQPKKRRGRPKGSKNHVIVPTTEELMAEDELEREIQSMLEKDNAEDSLKTAQEKLNEDKARERDEERARKDREAEAGLGIKEKEVPPSARTVTFGDDVPPPQEIVSREDLEREFADDPEVMNCLLPEMERKVKEQIWVAENEDWMRAQIAKEITARLDKEERANKRSQKGGKGSRKKKGRMGDGSTIAEATTPIETPLDANRAMYERRGKPKGISRHINYETLKKVYQPQRSPSSTSQSRDTSAAPSTASRAPSIAASETSRESGSPTPAPQHRPPQTPHPTQQAQSAADTAGSPEQRDVPEPMSPPHIKVAAPTDTGAGEADEDEGEEDDTIDHVQDDELDYGSDADGRSGWLGGEDDDREDIGEDEFGPLSRQALPRYGEDGAEYD